MDTGLFETGLIIDGNSSNIIFFFEMLWHLWDYVIDFQRAISFEFLVNFNENHKSVRVNGIEARKLYLETEMKADGSILI